MIYNWERSLRLQHSSDYGEPYIYSCSLSPLQVCGLSLHLLLSHSRPNFKFRVSLPRHSHWFKNSIPLRQIMQSCIYRKSSPSPCCDFPISFYCIRLKCMDGFKVNSHSQDLNDLGQRGEREPYQQQNEEALNFFGLMIAIGSHLEKNGVYAT